MKATGIIREVDEAGRIVVPKEIRKKLFIENTDPVEFFVEDDKIIIKKFNNTCIFCGKSADLSDFKGKTVCLACINEISNLKD